MPQHISWNQTLQELRDVFDNCFDNIESKNIRNSGLEQRLRKHGYGTMQKRLELLGIPYQEYLDHLEAKKQQAKQNKIQELFQELDSLYHQHGVKAITSGWLMNNGNQSLENALRNRGIKLQERIDYYSCQEDYDLYESERKEKEGGGLCRREFYQEFEKAYQELGISVFIFNNLLENYTNLHNYIHKFSSGKHEDFETTTDFKNHLLELYGIDKETLDEARRQQWIKTTGSTDWLNTEVVKSKLLELYEKVGRLPTRRDDKWVDAAESLIPKHQGISFKQFAEQHCGIRSETAKRSLNGDYWRSNAERQLADYFLSQGCQVIREPPYPDNFEPRGSTYDMQITYPDGRDFLVEVWGNLDALSNGNYSQRRQDKENYNAQLSNFIGIDWQDCIDEKIKSIFPSFEGQDTAFDSYCYTSLREELIHKSLEHFVDGDFPRTFKLDGQYYRQICDVFGGLDELREAIGLTRHVIRSDDELIDQWKLFIQVHGVDPIEFRKGCYAGDYYGLTREHRDKDRKWAGRIANYLTGHSSLKTWDIRKTIDHYPDGQNQESLLSWLDSFLDNHKILPSVFIGRHRKDPTKREQYLEAQSMTDLIRSRVGITQLNLAQQLGWKRENRNCDWYKPAKL